MLRATNPGPTNEIGKTDISPHPSKLISKSPFVSYFSFPSSRLGVDQVQQAPMSKSLMGTISNSTLNLGTDTKVTSLLETVANTDGITFVAHQSNKCNLETAFWTQQVLRKSKELRNYCTFVVLKTINFFDWKGPYVLVKDVSSGLACNKVVKIEGKDEVSHYSVI